MRFGTWVLAGVLLLGASGHSAPTTDTYKLAYVYATYGYSNSQRFSRAGGLFYDANRGELYVADTGNGQIVILDNKGTPISRIRRFVEDSASGERKTRAGEPKGVAVRKNGDILVTDNLCNYLDVLDFRGRSVQKLWPGDLLGLPRSKVMPRCLAIDHAENIYVSVSGAESPILVLTPDLKLKAQIGKVPGSEGERSITGLWVDKGGRIYSTYAQGDCVRIFAPDGRLIHKFGKHDTGYQNFSLPAGLMTDRWSNIWIVDTLRHAVTVFFQQPDGEGIKTDVIDALGGFGDKPGDLAYPTAIAGDGDTRVFVLEGTGARVQAFRIQFVDRK
jgi:DNA-binding beta-propeller fold protein YncE